MNLIESNYNPLKVIFTKFIKDINILSDIDYVTLQHINIELVKGGVIAENSSEFKTLLEMLLEIKKEYYGKS